ncbi:MAG TPA: hypothetical protein VGN29_11795 [Solirubrobacteraceae bacterium]|nr:hypothetical protein [Solirubrobacteraceae bacterium]
MATRLRDAREFRGPIPPAVWAKTWLDGGRLPGFHLFRVMRVAGGAPTLISGRGAMPWTTVDHEAAAGRLLVGSQ